MPGWSGVSPGLYSLSNSGLMLTSMSLLRLKSVTGYPSFVRMPQLFHGWRVVALCGRPAAWALRKDEGYMEICFSRFRGSDISERRAELNLHRLGKCQTA